MLSRAAGLFRLALRTQWACVRLLSSVAAGGEPPGSEDKPVRRVDIEALRRERGLRPPAEGTQPTPPRKVYRTPKPSYEQLQLNKAIRDSTSVDAVLDLAAARTPLLDCVGVASALLKTSKLVGNREPALWLKEDKRFKQLMKAARSLMERRAMDAQGFSNMLYACGQLGIAPPSSWLRVYWESSASELDKSVPQDFSNTLYACGQLGIMPTGEWLQQYWHASASKLGEFIPQALSNTMYACGQLGNTPRADWLQRYWHASTLKLGEFNEQELSNTLQRAGSWTSRRLPIGCCQPPADWLLQAQQLYQAYQAAAVERPGLLPTPDPELLAAARQSWINGMSETSSKLHDQVSACLARMGVPHANERWCERAERLIDIVIEGAEARVALEVDGPTHFLQDGRQDGSTLLRNRMLAAHGWRVVVVDYRVWTGLQTPSQREEYLRRLLA